ncbi:MAG: TonB-dependent receptor, partial [Pseudomonadota bacterium]
MKTQAYALILAVLVVVGIVGQVVPNKAVAQEDEAKTFAINRQPLSGALLEFAEQSGTEVLFDSRIAEGRTSPGVQGALSSREALRRLLAGTGVTFEYTGRNSVTLRRGATNSDAPAALGPIVVQGERRSRALRDTTSSVTVFSESDIERSDTDRVYGVLNQAPNVTPVPVPGEFLPPIRGVQSDGGGGGLGGNFLFGTQPRALLIVDDVARPSTTSNNAFQTTFDVEQTEVLRGPQTTLRGANAIAGAYIVKTKDPRYTPEAEIQGGLNWNQVSQFGYQVAGMANAPLIEDQLAARFVVQYEDGRIPVRVVDPTGFAPAGTDLKSLSDFDNLALRGKLLVEPEALPKFSAILTGEYENGRDAIFDSFINSSNFTGKPTRDRNTIASNGNVVDTKAYNFALNAAYDVTNDVEVRSITSYQKDEFKDSSDSIGSFIFENSDFRRFNQDLLLTFEGLADHADGVIGLTVEDESERTVEQSFILNSRGDRTTLGVFGDLEVALTDRLKVLAGARVQYTKFKFDLDFFGGFGGVNFDDRETVFLPKAGLSFDIDDSQTVFLTATRGYNP